MSVQAGQHASERLAQALAAFQKAQGLILTAHRQLRGVDQEDSERFWAGTGTRLDQHLRACASALVAAYRVFSAGGGVAAAGDRRLVNEAHQLLHEAGDRQAKPARFAFDVRRDELQMAQRLRDLIDQELERRGVGRSEDVATALGMTAKQAEDLLQHRAWRDGDVAALQAVAERLGLEFERP